MIGLPLAVIEHGYLSEKMLLLNMRHMIDPLMPTRLCRPENQRLMTIVGQCSGIIIWGFGAWHRTKSTENIYRDGPTLASEKAGN